MRDETSFRKGTRLYGGQLRKLEAYKRNAATSTQMVAGGKQFREYSRVLPDFHRKGRWLSNEEWLGYRARHAIIMLRTCTETNPKKCGGVPVLRGTRFTLAQVLAELADGRDVRGIADDFDLQIELLKDFLQGLAIYLDRPAARALEGQNS
ncbi:MAG: DUF433 domain-containing protein [Isosphaeraceae bacterium]|jgi:uncharacterized protein (DUF433 family)